MRRRDPDSGAVAIETALITGLLVLIVMGAFEYGMAFRSWFGLSASSREGARVGASVGPVDGADCAILEAAAAALASTSGNEVVRIKIFNHDPVNGTDGANNTYRPFRDGVDDPALQRCSNWFVVNFGWNETGRDNTGTDRDWLGVEVTYQHNWITGFLWWSGFVEWSNRSIMRLEPVNYGSAPPP
jgi:Flp pilus assembly protein TadG